MSRHVTRRRHRLAPCARRSARRRTGRCARRGRMISRRSCCARRCARAPGVDAAEVDDVVLGCAMPEAEQGLNVARIASLRAGLPVSASAVTVNRFCASGLEAIAAAADRVIASGAAEVVLAGGTESMSLVPMGGHKVAPNPHLVATTPMCISPRGSSPRTTRARAGFHARRRTPSRCAATSARSRRSMQGRFADEIVPVDVEVIDPSANGRPAVRRVRIRHRRRAAPRYVRRGAGQAQAGVPRGRAASPPATRRKRATAPRPCS